MIVDKNCNRQVLGSLMLNPFFLSESDKYNLTPQDFSNKFDKKIFKAIYTLYANGAKIIRPIDIEGIFSQDPGNKVLFEQSNGIEYLQDLQELAEVNNFHFYYNLLKKINLLNDLKKNGFDISSFYIEDLTDNRALEVNSKFETLSIKDIISATKMKLLHLENNYSEGEEVQIEDISEGIDELIDGFGSTDTVGLPVQGKYYNEVIGGARKGTLTIRSAASGTGKTRGAVMDACFLTFPLRYNSIIGQWEQQGNNGNSLYIVTEQNKEEIQKMVLAYLTDINEDRFKYGNFSEEELKIIEQGKQVIKRFKDNFIIIRMPNPSIELLKSTVREQCILHNIDYVFYDYIFICPSLLNEFKGFALRNDEILLMMSTALKDLAVELDVAVFTSTQVNAKADDNKEIKNESSIAGSRAIINKADNGCIMSRPTKEEIDLLKPFIDRFGTPNLVTDIYKIRSGRWTQLRIWSYVSLGTLRKEDLFVTDSRLDTIDDFEINTYGIVNWSDELSIELSNMIKEFNEGV